MRRAAAASHDVVAAVRDARVLVALDPVIQQVVVSRDDHADAVLPEERVVELANRGGIRFDTIAAVWAG